MAWFVVVLVAALKSGSREPKVLALILLVFFVGPLFVVLLLNDFSLKGIFSGGSTYYDDWIPRP